MKLCLVTVASLVALTPVFLVSAQTVLCGNIITPVNFDYEGSEEYSDPIQDCSNPLARTGDLTNLKLFNQIVTNNAVIAVDATGTDNYMVGDENYFMGSGAVYYKHSDQDLIRVRTDISKPTRLDVEKSIRVYFNGDEAQTQKYTDIYFDTNRQTLFYDDYYHIYYFDNVANDFVWRVFAFVDGHVLQTVHSSRPKLLPGTYTVAYIDTDEGMGPSLTFENTFIQRLFATIIPTAEAYYYVNTVTFTLEGPTPEPLGASSVLFLPGIQASRLYAGEDGPGGDAYERVWEPGNNSDVEALAMTGGGVSINEVYTSDILKTITTDLLFGYKIESGSVYQGFSNFMDTLVTDQTIREWYPFAYDWRYDVFDIVKNGTIINQSGTRDFPTKIAKDLAKRSKSGKVTIVAHSNGGLLAKALMIELSKTGDDSLVDKIVFLGTPQLGTPKAIGTILHGYDQTQGGGFVIKDLTARRVLNNFPGAYALLPSELYLSQASTPVISFDDSISTASYRTTYGTLVTSLQSYQNFLNGTQAENRSLNSKIYEPVGTNSGLLSSALENHRSLLDSWIAPSSTKVVSIIGTGIPTMKALRYEDVIENICPASTVFSTLSLCAVERIPRPFAVMTYFGDKTVTGLSAKGYVGESEKYFVDLIKINAQNVINNNDIEINHANIAETSYVQSLIKSLISTSTVPTIPYIITHEPVVIEPYIIQQIASPVYIHSVDNEGRVSGYIKQSGAWVLKQDIPGSQYFEFAGVKYLLIPSNIDFKTTLAGQEFGGYTYKISELNDSDTQIQLSQLVNATTAPNMIAILEKKNGQFSTIKTDYEGDGVFDYESTANGVKIIPAPMYTYKKLIEIINLLSIKKSQKDMLLFLAREAEKLDIKSSSSSLAAKLEKVTLKILESTVVLFQKNRLITATQAEELVKNIKFLSQ